MTVKQVREELSKYPDSMDVFLTERVTDFTYGLANSVCSKEIDFMEEPGAPVLAKDKVVVISEE